VNATDTLTGSEIEKVFGDALYRSFGEDKEPIELTVAEALGAFIPCPRPWPIRLPG